MSSAADAPSSGAHAAKDGVPTASAGNAPSSATSSSLAAQSSAPGRSDDHQAAHHSLNSVNLTLLDPARWGWTAAGGVADLLPPHEVRFDLRPYGLRGVLPMHSPICCPFCHVPCSELDDERPSAIFSLPSANLRALPLREAMLRAAFGCLTIRVRRRSPNNPPPPQLILRQ